MNALGISQVATQLIGSSAKTPFIAGRNAVLIGTAALVAQGSEDGTNYTTLATIPANGVINIPSLPSYIKLSTTATAYLLGGV